MTKDITDCYVQKIYDTIKNSKKGDSITDIFFHAADQFLWDHAGDCCVCKGKNLKLGIVKITDTGINFSHSWISNFKNTKSNIKRILKASLIVEIIYDNGRNSASMPLKDIKFVNKEMSKILYG